MAGRQPSRRPVESSTSPRSSRQSASLRLSTSENIFSDEFALEPLSASGNSSPSTPPLPYSQSTHTTPTSTSQEHLHRSNSETTLRSPSLDPPDQVGGSQDHVHRESSTSYQDSPFSDPIPQRGPSVRSTSTAASRGPQRSFSTTSSYVPPRAASPYHGPTGPSHPYSMYPQGVTRTSTISSNSTVRPTERAFVPGTGPEHPYSLYPQNTVPEMEEDPRTGFIQIPVGFPGHGASYQRRRGPDGEDVADIIGPDGHTEQLPAYSRYPDGIAPKNGLLGPASILSEERVDEVVVGQQPESGTPRSANSSTDASGNFKEKLAEKGRKRVCRGCIPLWILALALLMLLIGVIIGGVVGGIAANKKGVEAGKDEAAAEASPSTIFSTVTATTFIDATPLPSSYGLPPLPLGTFEVPINPLKSQSNSCLDPSEGFAWACETGGSLTITMSQSSKGVKQVDVDANWFNNGTIVYGPQPPQLTNQPYKLSMMLDKDSPNLGPALFFWDYYDKIVIVPEDSFSSSNSKRSVSESDILSGRGMNLQQQTTANPGERPWFCVWNSTVLELFIYVTQNTTAVQSSSAAAASAAGSGLTSNPSNAATSSSVPGAAMSTAAMTSNPASASSGMPSYRRNHEYEPEPDYHEQHSHSRRSAGWNPVYPRVIKVEEKRKSSNAIQPYCQQFQVLYDGGLGFLADNAGNPITTTLSETEPSQVSSKKQRNYGVKKRQDMQSNCCCEWISG